MCVEIAGVFGLDAVDVFRLAGYLPMTEAAPDSPRKADARRLKRKLIRILDGIPEQHWVLMLLYLDTTLDQAVTYALRLNDVVP
jgi:hypothetical protein